MSKGLDNLKMKHQNSFVDVLCNGDNQDIVRELLNLYTPLHVKEKIINEFNAHVDRFNAQKTS